MKVVKITGMSCRHCVEAVKKALSEIDGVKNIKVSLERGEASFDEEKPVDMEMVRKQIEQAGYKVG